MYTWWLLSPGRSCCTSRTESLWTGGRSACCFTRCSRVRWAVQAGARAVWTKRTRSKAEDRLSRDKTTEDWVRQNIFSHTQLALLRLSSHFHRNNNITLSEIVRQWWRNWNSKLQSLTTISLAFDKKQFHSLTRTLSMTWRQLLGKFATVFANTTHLRHFQQFGDGGLRGREGGWGLGFFGEDILVQFCFVPCLFHTAFDAFYVACPSSICLVIRTDAAPNRKC